MLEGFSSVGLSLTQHPWVSLALFVLVGGGVIVLFSGAKWLASLIGILRVSATFFTTPFEFIRDALALVRGANESEKDYARSRIFMLFRYSRLQYLAALFVALLILTSGFTSALLSLYPAGELERRSQLRQEVQATQTGIENVNRTLEQIGTPQYRQTLEEQRNSAREEHNRAQAGYAQVAQSSKFTSDFVDAINRTADVDSLNELRGEIETYVSTCPNPYNWTGFTEADCSEFQTFVTQLVDARIVERNAYQALSEAEDALRNSDTAAETTRNELRSLESRLATAREDLRSTPIFRPEWISNRLPAALTILLMTALGVIIFIWMAAIFIDVLNWIILMMRSLERTQAEKLENSKSDYDS